MYPFILWGFHVFTGMVYSTTSLVFSLEIIGVCLTLSFMAPLDPLGTFPEPSWRQVQKQLGKGSFGTVYLVSHRPHGFDLVNLGRVI